MLNPNKCRNCSSGGNLKCRNPCPFRDMPQNEYNALQNHIGRNQYRTLLLNNEVTLEAPRRPELIRCLIEESSYWVTDNIRGTIGKINTMETEMQAVNNVLIQISAATAAQTPADAIACFEAAGDHAAVLAPGHQARLGLALALSSHNHTSLQLDHAITTAREALDAVVEAELPAQSVGVYGLLRDKYQLWQVEQGKWCKRDR